MDVDKLKKLGAFVLGDDNNTMNVMNDVQHTEENGDVLPDVRLGADSNELLDYIALAVARSIGGLAAFKGGYMLNKLLKEDSRLTHDVDFSVGEQETYEKLKVLLTDIADKFCSAGVIESYKVKDVIQPTMSGGIDMYSYTGQKILGVDVGWHDISWGITDYKLDITTVRGFEIERMLADKTIAILSRKRFRRTKDLYDFWAITNVFDFDFNKLLGYIELKGGAEWSHIPFSEEVLIQYRKAWDKLDLRTPTYRELVKPEFSVVIGRFCKIADSLKAKARFTKWCHESKSFVES